MPYADPEKRKEFWRKRDAKRRPYLKAYREKNRDKIQAQKHSHYLLNRDRILAKDSIWKKAHKDEIRIRRGRDHVLVCSIATRLRSCLKKANVPKTHPIVVLLGCSIPNFKIYIESKFEVGMRWENWGRGEGKWHLDHIMPVSIFDLSKSSHQKRCFHFSNYQPLWEPENFKKGCKPPQSHQFRML